MDDLFLCFLIILAISTIHGLGTEICVLGIDLGIDKYICNVIKIMN